MTFLDATTRQRLSDVARAARGDWILTSREAVDDDRFVARCYASALFTLPGMVPGRPDLALLPNPVRRYCLELRRSSGPGAAEKADEALRQVDWARGPKMRAARRRRFRFSMDRDFAGSLGKLRAHHAAGKDGTWFDDALFATIVRMHQRQNQETSGSGGIANSRSEASILPRIYHHVFELWDADSGELLAVTAGFSCGRAYHDYSMACLVRDKRSSGHVLSKTVGDLLSKCGFEFWYWGFKTGYMKEYDKFGGRDVGRAEFFDRWERVAKESPERDLSEAIAAGDALVAPWAGPAVGGDE